MDESKSKVITIKHRTTTTTTTTTTKQVIPLAHAQLWPVDGTSHSVPYVLRPVAEVGSAGGSGSAGGASSGSSNWARTVLAMGQSVSGSIGRAASIAMNTSGGGSSGGGGGAGLGGSSSGRNSGRHDGQVGLLDDACSGIAAVAGRGPSVAWSADPGSSLSSWRGMRSGATWAFGGGECCAGGRRGCHGRGSVFMVVVVVAVLLMLFVLFDGFVGVCPLMMPGAAMWAILGGGWRRCGG